MMMPREFRTAGGQPDDWQLGARIIGGCTFGLLSLLLAFAATMLAGFIQIWACGASILTGVLAICLFAAAVL